MENNTGRPHILRKKDYATRVHVDEGDKTILKVYKKILKTSMTAALHFFLALERAVLRKNMTNRSKICRKECVPKQELLLST